MAKRVVYHVTPTDTGWQVKKEGGQRASVRTENKAEAVTTARDLAKNVPGNSQVKVHKEDGTIQTEYTYGNDPKRYPG